MADDIKRSFLYESPGLTPEGLAQWPKLLMDAVEHHTDDWLTPSPLQDGRVLSCNGAGDKAPIHNHSTVGSRS